MKATRAAWIAFAMVFAAGLGRAQDPELDAIVARFGDASPQTRSAAVKEFRRVLKIRQSRVPMAKADWETVDRYHIFSDLGADLEAMVDLAAGTDRAEVGRRIVELLRHRGLTDDPALQTPRLRALRRREMDPVANFFLRQRPEVVRDLMKDPRIPVRGVLLRGMREERDAPLLLRFARDRNPILRASAIEALGAFKTDEVRRAIRTAAIDADAGVRAVAAIGLGNWRDDEVVDDLLRLFRDRDDNVRTEAAGSLRQVDSMRGASALVEMMAQGVDPGTAMAAFGKNVPASAFPYFLALFENPEGFALGAILNVIVAIDNTKARRFLCDLATKAGDLNRRAHGLLFLGRMRDYESETILLDTLNDPNDILVRVACQAIWERRLEAAVPQLRALASKGRTDEVRRTAADALEAITGRKGD